MDHAVVLTVLRSRIARGALSPLTGTCVRPPRRLARTTLIVARSGEGVRATQLGRIFSRLRRGAFVNIGRAAIHRRLQSVNAEVCHRTAGW
ncbi:hypothetical protein EVAR_17272_1 [Eumeta japonica]|uniref:Uncharacterized protein n=1 Tax=Eumeta variegata TaxID=151549 RepID=A0A4C1TT22_EUMVA|nr:hypothetical protein EVAR_17272_1 [Eumeta japonica]